MKDKEIEIKVSALQIDHLKAPPHPHIPDSERKYRILTENISLGIFRTAPGERGEILEVNPVMVAMLGYDAETEILHRDACDFYEKPGNRSVFSEKILRDGFVKNEELILKKKDGTRLVVLETSIAVKNESGEVLYFEGIIEDITQQKKAQQELELQRTYYRQLFNCAPEAIILHDTQDIVTDINREFTRMFGYTREECVGRHINDIVASPGYLDNAEQLSYQVTHGMRVDAESVRKRRDGSLIDVSILGAPIFHDGRQIGIYAIYRDITEKKRIEENRIRQQEEARMAHQIQMNLLPKHEPRLSGYDIAGKSIPALNVGGDYYDYIQLDEHRWAFGLGDVSGKGLAAALVMSNLQATIRSLSITARDPAACLCTANKLLFNSVDAKTFVTLFYAILDTSSHTLHYTNAGHNYPFLISRTADAFVLEKHGMALGLQENTSYTADTVRIAPGDKLILYSDGIPEAMDTSNRPYGEESMLRVIAEHTRVSSRELIEDVLASVKDHCRNASRSDDITIVSIIRAGR